MLITVDVKTCRNCRHIDHSGAFTVRGARPICGHSDACKRRKTKGEFRKEYPEYAERDTTHWKYHWYHRILGESDAYKLPIPDWCPLKHGSAY